MSLSASRLRLISYPLYPRSAAGRPSRCRPPSLARYGATALAWLAEPKLTLPELA
jgi:hypothetical protein